MVGNTTVPATTLLKTVGINTARPFDTYYSVYWYQPHNDSGRPDSNSYRRLGYEMLGVSGYSNGYVAYMSGKNANDLAALRDITKNNTITWKEYKLKRYDYVKANLSKITLFNVSEAQEEFKNALIKDAAANNRQNSYTNAVRKKYYYLVKRATNDFLNEGIFGSNVSDIDFNVDYKEKSLIEENLIIEEEISSEEVLLEENILDNEEILETEEVLEILN
jgi:hypothetical protein